MVHVIAPKVYGRAYPLTGKDILHHTSRAYHLLFPFALPGTENDVAGIKHRDVLMVDGQIRHVVHDGVHIEGAVHEVIAEEVAGIVSSAQCDDAVEEIRSAQEGVKCVGSPHAASCSDWRKTRAVDILDDGQEFFHDVSEPQFLKIGAKRLPQRTFA